MSTRVRLSREYPHGVPAFAAALADPEFHRVKLDLDGSAAIEVVDVVRETTEDGVEVRLTLRQPVPATVVPAALEQLVRGRLVLERHEHWTLAEDRCSGRTEVAVPHTPIGAQGWMEVTPSGAGSTLAVDLEVTASVPLLGGGIERAVLAGIRRLTGSEHERISAWLAHAADGS